MSLRICVYAIARNEEKFVKRFCEAARPADCILICDTGSTDETVFSISELQTTPQFRNNLIQESIYISPWRFDLARNAALALVPPYVDVCVSLDLDEELQPGWREAIEKVWKKGETTRLRYMFDWGVGIKFKYEKIHSRHGYRWHHPCHEYPVPDARLNEVWADTGDELLVIHKPDNSKSRSNYLELLRLSVTEDPDCPRNAFYFARELSFHKHWREAINACDRYLVLPRATWQNERCYARRVQGRCWVELGQLDKAFAAFLQAASEAPGTREPWYELADLMRVQARWPECLAFALKTLAIGDRDLVYTVDPEVWGWKPHHLAALACWHLGMRDQAQKHSTDALALGGDVKLLHDNHRFYTGEWKC